MSEIVNLKQYRKEKSKKRIVESLNILDFVKIFNSKGKEMVITVLENVIRALKE